LVFPLILLPVRRGGSWGVLNVSGFPPYRQYRTVGQAARLVAIPGGWSYKAPSLTGLTCETEWPYEANRNGVPRRAQPQRTDMEGIVSLVPLILIFLIMYFLLIRPQQRKLKEHQAMVSALRRGDQVVTQGGLIGKVTKVKDEVNEIEVEIAPNVNVRVVRSTVASVLNKTEPAKS
jgi:preprotein translocase subunit YajC